MSAAILLLGIFICATHAAPPAGPGRFPQQAPHQVQQLNALDYYLDNPDVANYYNQAQQKQGTATSSRTGAPARLENLDNPDSEVELIPGAQQPQTPQQTPVSPNLPGLIPGQRVYIVHMPVAGYRPGSIGGYQPFYVVAAAPNANPNYVQGGYQNAIFLDPSGQGIAAQFPGYQRPGYGPGYAGYLVAGGAPLALSRPYDAGYQDPAAFGFQPVVGVAPNNVRQGEEATRGNVRLSQLVAIQGQQQASSSQTASAEKETAGRSRLANISDASDSKEASEERRNTRPSQPLAHAQRNQS